MSFKQLGLCDALLTALAEQGYHSPSAIQRAAIPAVLSGQDILAGAHTGTGKTAAFCLPILQLLSRGEAPQAKQCRALIVAPTRELAAQVAKQIEHYGRYLDLRFTAVFGGVRIEPQIAKLQVGVHVLVATPGRLLDLHQQQAVDFSQLDILVLDEADHMLDLGFIDDIGRIQALLPDTRQTLLFSATFSAPIKALAKSMLKQALVLDVNPLNSTVNSVTQRVYRVDKSRKTALLIHLLTSQPWEQVLVFTASKHGADKLVEQLDKAGIVAATIHANRTQHARTQVLDGFRNAQIKVLIATDIASRGIDIQQLPCVINLDLPFVAQDYVHRIGRTGRSGQSGLALSLVSNEDLKTLQAIEQLIGRKLEQEWLAGFTPIQGEAIKQTKAKPVNHDDDEYGHFEANTPGSRGAKKTGRNGRLTKISLDQYQQPTRRR